MTGKFAGNLAYAIVNNNDLETVKTGGPAYLLMVDSLIRDDPDNEALLRAAANLYSAYTDIYVQDSERARKLTEKGLSYAIHALCVRYPDACAVREMPFGNFEQFVAEMKKDDIPALYVLGSTWAGWIEARRDDWNAVADIARVETLMKQVIVLDETWQDGGAHLYLGILATLLPPAMGGEPEKGREHFERALTISRGKNFMVKVIYARQYARMTFNRKLHDLLLKDVIQADPAVDGYTLMNTLAQEQAHDLLKTAEDYF